MRPMLCSQQSVGSPALLVSRQPERREQPRQTYFRPGHTSLEENAMSKKVCAGREVWVQLKVDLRARIKSGISLTPRFIEVLRREGFGLNSFNGFIACLVNR